MSNNTFKPDNISYTNKDFPSIYDELLKLVPQFTNKWDPNLSNESDPLVVLLKLNALLADKNDYNIDKNILELFPLSVTQRGNAQKIYESLGYPLRWYESASVEVNLRWIGEGTAEGTIDLSDNGSPFRMITDDSGEIVYTIIPTNVTSLSLQTSPSLNNAKNDLKTIALEGTVHDYEINGNTTITLQNLDSDLRLYFNESQIAENGIFIQSDSQSWTQWNRVDNLESTSLSQYNYKFGVLPNSNTCYIEFPQDIANLIGQGLKIKYIISSGAAGTIQPNTLTSFYSDINYDLNNDGTEEPINDKIRIWNSNASSEGKDPESLESAYRNYQKIVNTFNTLVTCKDYENAIFRLKEETTGKPLVSNCVVADRTNDINASLKIQNLTAVGNNIILSQTNEANKMEPFDLKFYLLKYIYPITNREQYNSTFKTEGLLYVKVPQELEEYKSIQHDIIPLGEKYNPYIIKNKYSISCQLTTYNKVSEKEARDIEKNACLALFKNYNSREVEFGEALDYNDVVETIQNSDKRIKNVILQPLSYTPYVTDYEGNETEISYNQAGDPSLNKTYLNILAKNILAGNTQGIKFNHSFNYEFNQTDVGIKEDITSITTTTQIPLNSSYALKSNESLILYSPNYILDTTYANYLYYVIENAPAPTFNSKEDIVDFPTGTIKFYNKRYDKSTGTSNQKWNYSPDDLVGTIEGPAYLSFSGWAPGENMEVEGELGSNKTISTYNKNYQKLTPVDNGEGQFIYCYWVLNNPSNKFDFKEGGDNGTYSYMLRNGEYFLYPNSSLTELNILGSGTSIKFNTPSNPDNVVIDSSRLNASTITNTSINDIDWYKIPGTIEVTENKLISLGFGTTIELSGTTNTGTNYISNSPEITLISGGTYTTEENTEITLPETPGNWKAFATINLLGSKELPLPLYAGQSLTFNRAETPSVSGESSNEKPIKFVQFNPAISLPGGVDISVSYLNDYLEESQPIGAYWYTENSPIDREENNGLIQISLEPGQTITYNVPSGNYIIPVIWSSETEDFTVEIGGASLYTNSSTQLSPSTNAQFLKIVGTQGTSTLTFTSSNPSAESRGILTIGKLYKIETNGDMAEDLKETINTLDPTGLFNYTYEVPELINVPNPTTAEGLFDSNNFLNRFVIAQMDTSAGRPSIKVINSSKL